MIWNEKRLLIFNYENENFCKTMLQKDYFTFSPDMNYFACVCVLTVPSPYASH